MDRYKIRYVSPHGRALDLSEAPYDANGTELPSWEHRVTALNGTVAGFSRGMPKFSMRVTISANETEEGLAARDALYEVPAADVASMTPGRLYMGDWYLTGYMTASEPDNFWQTGEAAEYELEFVAESPKWTRETTFHVGGRQDGQSMDLDFPFDYPHDLGGSRSVDTVENANFAESPSIVRFYGLAVNPRATIGGNAYQVDVTLGEGDYVEIDGLAATATVRRANGAAENAFQHLAGEMAHGSGSYPFQPIPPGVSEVQWSGNFDIDVVMLEQRDEPRWS